LQRHNDLEVVVVGAGAAGIGAVPCASQRRGSVSRSLKLEAGSAAGPIRLPMRRFRSISGAAGYSADRNLGLTATSAVRRSAPTIPTAVRRSFSNPIAALILSSMRSAATSTVLNSSLSRCRTATVMPIVASTGGSLKDTEPQLQRKRQACQFGSTVPSC
jgi:hypothetical protein